MNRALLAEMLRRRRAFVVGAIAAAVVVIVSGATMPIGEAAPLWSLAVVLAVVHGSVHDTGDVESSGSSILVDQNLDEA